MYAQFMVVCVSNGGQTMSMGNACEWDDGCRGWRAAVGGKSTPTTKLTTLTSFFDTQMDFPLDALT